jgi:hypothetical protein
MPDEDTQAYLLDKTVDKVEPEFGGLEKQEATNILQVLDKLEDVSDALLSRFDFFSVIMEYNNYAFINIVFQ